MNQVTLAPLLIGGEPSDSNHGITLKEAKLNFSTFGACEKEMVCYVRLPRDDEKEIS